MKVIAFILDPPVIRKILEHLRGLAHGPLLRPGRGRQLGLSLALQG